MSVVASSPSLDLLRAPCKAARALAVRTTHFVFTHYLRQEEEEVGVLLPPWRLDSGDHVNTASGRHQRRPQEDWRGSRHDTYGA